MRNYYLVLFLAMTLGACNMFDNRTEMEKNLIGTWESLSIRVEINSEGKEMRVLDVPKSQWKEKFKIRPIRTTYNADSTYTSIYTSLEGQIITSNKGTWMVKNNMLEMREIEPKKETFKYEVEFSADSAFFKGEIAWDNDGVKNDKYEAWQIKVDTGDK